MEDLPSFKSLAKLSFLSTFLSLQARSAVVLWFTSLGFTVLMLMCFGSVTKPLAGSNS